MIALLDPRVWLVVAGLMLASYGGGRWHQYKSDSNAAAAAELRATQEARAKEAAWSAETSRIRDAKDLELASVSAQRDDALKRLRDRPINRLPPASDAACAGASPAALNATDATVAVEYAAEFDRLRAEYQACRSYVETVTTHR